MLPILIEEGMAIWASYGYEAVDAEEKTVYEMYYDRAEALNKIPNHRVLAVNRGEKEKKLKVKVTVNTEEIHELIGKSVIKTQKSIFFTHLQDTIADAYKRLMAPSIEREMRNLLTERAEAEAVKIFAKNTMKALPQCARNLEQAALPCQI